MLHTQRFFANSSTAQEGDPEQQPTLDRIRNETTQQLAHTREVIAAGKQRLRESQQRIERSRRLLGLPTSSASYPD
jgi:CHASE3 domain sensor protein